MTSRSSVATARTLPFPSGSSRFLTSSTASTRSAPTIATGDTRKRSRTVRGAPLGSRAAKPRRISTFRWTMFDASASSASLAGSSSSSDGSTRMSAPARSPISWSSVDVQAACTGPRRPRTTISRIPDLHDRLDRRIRGVGGCELLPGQREHARDVQRDVPVADDHGALSGEVEVELLEVRVAVVPGDELGGSPRAGQVLARNAETTVRLRADGIHHRVVVLHELRVRDVLADLDVAEETEPWSLGDALERARDGLQVRMVGRDAEADQAPRRRQPLDHVHLGRRIGAREQVPGGVERRRPGSDDRDAERHACAVVAHGSPSYCRAQGSSRHADRSRDRPRRGGARSGSGSCGGTAVSRARTT